MKIGEKVRLYFLYTKGLCSLVRRVLYAKVFLVRFSYADFPLFLLILPSEMSLIFINLNLNSLRYVFLRQ